MFLVKATNEYLVMNTKYNEYNKNTYENLINIANNWILDECDVGSSLYGFNGQVVGTAKKKAKKKSDVQLEVYIIVIFIKLLHNSLFLKAYQFARQH